MHEKAACFLELTPAKNLDKNKKDTQMKAPYSQKTEKVYECKKGWMVGFVVKK